MDALDFPNAPQEFNFPSEETYSKKRAFENMSMVSIVVADPVHKISRVEQVCVKMEPQQETVFSTEDVSAAKIPKELNGESRLRINFLNYGRAGPMRQRFGRGKCCVPDGLSGTHEMYEQNWKFEIIHHFEGNTTVITWKVTNLASGTVTQVKETPKQAALREMSGRTICNKVVKSALESRSQELERSLADGTSENQSRKASTRNLVAILRPKLCTVGLLFFGLLHESVQNKFPEETL